MASTYSTNLKLELIGTGEQAGTWGVTTNTNLGTALEQSIVGKADVAMSSTTITLSLTNSNAAQDARAIYLNLTGSPGGAAVLEVPAVQKPYIVKNGSDQQVTIKVSGQTGVAIPTGKTVIVYNNGTDVVSAIDYIPVLTTPDLTATTADINGGSIDGATLGTNSAITEADIDNININGNTISTTDTNGSLTLTPDGTGEVVTTKWMSGVFSDKLTAKGNLGATSTLTASNGTVFTATLDQSCTLTVSGSNATANRATSFTLVLTRGTGGPFTLTLAGGTFLAADGALSPTTTDSTTDIWFFFTVDGGSNWYVSIPIKNASSI
jgi:hypothetical protein